MLFILLDMLIYHAYPFVEHHHVHRSYI